MSHKIVVLMADGTEESEALVPVDLMRRCGYDVKILSINATRNITSSHGIKIETDGTVNDGLGNYDLIMIPGGMPGTTNIESNELVINELKRAYANGKWIAAICAAPMILGKLGMLKGKEAICFPGFEQYLDGAQIVKKHTVVSDNIITGIGAGAAIFFGLEIIRQLDGKQLADKIASSIMLNI